LDIQAPDLLASIDSYAMSLIKAFSRVDQAFCRTVGIFYNLLVVKLYEQSVCQIEIEPEAIFFYDSLAFIFGLSMLINITDDQY